MVNSHLHWDHCRWNTTATKNGPQPTFPNAIYYTRRGEWEHAHRRHARDSVAYIDANYDPLVDSGRMRLVDEDIEVAPGVRICLAAGHTRDMLIVTAVSEGQTFCFLTDLVPTATHVTPTWITAFDLYPLTAVDSKIRWLTEAVRGGWLCGFGHDPDIAFARVTQQGGKFEAVPCG